MTYLQATALGAWMNYLEVLATFYVLVNTAYMVHGFFSSQTVAARMESFEKNERVTLQNNYQAAIEDRNRWKKMYSNEVMSKVK